MSRFRCVECGAPIVVKRLTDKRHAAAASDHDLCQKCWKALRDSLRGGKGGRYKRFKGKT